MDIRNLNRTWPGKADGSIVEQTCYAFMELIKKEGVGLFMDLHEAELEYPVISTIVTNQNAQEVAAMASMTLTAFEFERPYRDGIFSSLATWSYPSRSGGLFWSTFPLV